MAATISNHLSIYKKAFDTNSQETIPFDIFIENIRSGFWQDYVLPLRALSEEQRQEAKKKVPCVTLSGVFSERNDAALTKHSGLISIDIDDCDPEEVKSIICADRHVLAAFTSISGRGLCAVFKINPEKHRESFAGISEYLFNNYEIVVDPTSVNPSRLRYVSYDPALYFNERADKFTQLPKNKPPKKVEKVIFDQSDFEQVLKQITERRLNLCENYHDWFRIGFAIASKFFETGREYFHLVSQYSAKYNPRICDKQYDALLKRAGAPGGRDISISTFYYYAKQAGIPLYSERTKVIAYTTAQGKKAGLGADAIADNLAKFEGITDADAIIQQVLTQNIEINEDTLLDQLELWIRQNYSLQRNEVTRYIENNGTPMQQDDFNSVFIAAKKIFPELTYDLLDRLIRSKFVPTYNPFHRYLDENAGILSVSLEQYVTPQGEVIPFKEQYIPRLFNCISTKDSDYALHFGRKWLVSCISAIYGQHSPLMLVLSGEVQNTGKTEFFRRLLPKDLHHYYAESKLDAGKDDEILMTQKLLIMDDEMGGKSKKEVKRLKELTSKQTFSLREPYGRQNVDLVRLAVLCGTTNDSEILSDPTGNRRLIPIHVFSINHGEYNSIDKNMLWIEAYHLYKNGYDWQLSRKDIAYLAEHTGDFEMSVAETELVLKYFKKGIENWTASDIKVYIENKTNQRLNMTRLGLDLKRLGFEQEIVRVSGTVKRVYKAEPLTPMALPPAHDPEDVPF